MKVLKYAAGAAIGSGLVIGSMIGGGAAQADTAIDAQTHTKYAYGPYTSDQCHTVLMNHPALNHRCEVQTGILAEECSTLLSDFFRAKRKA